MRAAASLGRNAEAFVSCGEREIWHHRPRLKDHATFSLPRRPHERMCGSLRSQGGWRRSELRRWVVSSARLLGEYGAAPCSLASCRHAGRFGVFG